VKLVLKIAGGLVLASVVLIAGCGALLSSGANDTAGSSSSEDVSVPAEAEEKKAETAFENGVLTTSDVKIEITDHKVIPAGAKGNEYGDKPVLALWYTTTNVSGKDVDPMEFLFQFEAYQDNDPNAENTLDVGGLPDDRFLDSQMENIKKGGTVENAVAYELDDLTTPVKLVALENVFDDEELGSVTYNLK
jgi:hypothetical protein